MLALLLVFVVAPALLAGLVLGAWALLAAGALPLSIVVPTAIVLAAIWLSTAAIIREIRRR